MDQVDLRPIQEPVHLLVLRRIAAEQAVIAQDPEIAPPRHRLVRGLGDGVVVGEAGLVRLLAGEQLREPVGIETDEAEIEVVLPERIELDPQ